MCNVAVDPDLTAVEHQHHHHSGASTTMLAQMHVTTAVTRTPALIMVAWELHQCAAVTLVGSADSPDH